MNDDTPDPQGKCIPPELVPALGFLLAARRQLRELEATYEFDGNNPLDVWEAIDWACRAGMELPEWIMSYLGAAAGAIVSLCETGQRVPKQAERVGKILGFGVKGPGRNSCFEELALREDDRQIYFAVSRITRPIIKRSADGKQVFHAGVKLDVAYDIVAREWEVDRSTVVRACSRALQRWRKRMAVNVEDEQELEFVSSMAAHVRLGREWMNEGLELAEAARREDEEAAENRGASEEGGEKQQ